MDTSFACVVGPYVVSSTVPVPSLAFTPAHSQVRRYKPSDWFKYTPPVETHVKGRHYPVPGVPVYELRVADGVVHVNLRVAFRTVRSVSYAVASLVALAETACPKLLCGEAREGRSCSRALALYAAVVVHLLSAADARLVWSAYLSYYDTQRVVNWQYGLLSARVDDPFFGWSFVSE